MPYGCSIFLNDAPNIRPQICRDGVLDEPRGCGKPPGCRGLLSPTGALTEWSALMLSSDEGGGFYEIKTGGREANGAQ